MKIVARSNFNKDTVSDFLVCENINRTHGKMAVELFNDQLGGDYGIYCYTLQEDDYELYFWEP